MEDESKRLCNNCHQMVSVHNWLLHESRCARINTVCPKCKEPVLKDKMAEHEEEYHAIESCDLCRKRVEKWQMEKHKEQECVRRPLRCDYCRLDVPMQDFSEHEQVCGSRTDKCHLCGRYVKLMDLDDHMKYCGQEVEKPSTTPPTKSAPPQQALQRMRETGGYRENVLEHIIPTNVHPNYSGISTYRHTDKKPGTNEPIDLTREDSNSPPTTERPSVGDHDSSGVGGEVTVPCEECGKDIPWSTYEEHVKKCSYFDFVGEDPQSSDDMPQVFSSISFQNFRVPSVGNAGENYSMSGNPNSLPQRSCEHCQRSVPVPLYAEHVANCQETRFDRSQNSFGSPEPLLGFGNETSSQRDASNHMDSNMPRDTSNRMDPNKPRDTSNRMDSNMPRDTSNRMDPNRPRDTNTQEDVVHLPCEFCDRSFPMSDLELHQRFCSTENKYKADHHEEEPPPSVMPAVEDNIPCEYCETLVNITDLESHQASCEKNPLVESQRRKLHSQYDSRRETSDQLQSGDVLCKYCYGQFSKLAIKNHQEICPNRIRERKKAPKTPAAMGNSHGIRPNMVVCRYCEMSFSSAVIDQHEERCFRKPEILAPDPPLLSSQEVQSEDVKREPSGPLEFIPCEFCGKQIKKPFIFAHQASCAKNPGVFATDPPVLSNREEPNRGSEDHQWEYEDPKVVDLTSDSPSPTSFIKGEGGVGKEPSASDDSIPCEFCGQNFNKCYLYGHQGSCPQNPNLICTDPLLFDDSVETPEDESTERIPCEMCDRTFPFSQIYRHQIQCRGSAD